ncbi:DUF805 domain-containing protein [Selenomonas sp. F0473]|uniref:DUF805 domain-containing protein n=1 Tax=Selenomonas sp. F0473 TaxID=999423 RepID=UPI00029EB690|nr:DUF805 domain-containing protein [Selenomonas sp. F0473]EKU71121.1 hypothetical protein HMPREF9161_01215 [Selenomonas sp. F0473]
MHPIDHGFRAHFFVWRGRLNRMRHFKRQVAALALYCAVLALLILVLDTLEPYMQYDMTDAYKTVTLIVVALMVLVSLLYLVSGTMLQIRRLHDLNMSGYFLLLTLVPGLDVILFLYLTFAKGTEGDNRFGHDPLGPADTPDFRKENPPACAASGTHDAQRGDNHNRCTKEGEYIPLDLLSRSGRLSRRDFALTVGILFGGSGLIFLLLEVLSIPLIYYIAVFFFRDMTAAFWTMMTGAWFIACIAVCLALLTLSLPAVIRRLHDMNCSGWLALPLVPCSLIILGFTLISSLLSIGIALSVIISGNPTGYIDGFDLTTDMNEFLTGSIFLIFLIFMVTLPLLSAYAAFLFFKKGSPAENRWGAPPISDKRPPERAAFFSTNGSIERRLFITRTLLLLAAAGVIIPTALYLVSVPIFFILIGLGILPFGAHMHVFAIALALYPIAALPLVIRRLRTLGRSPYEAVFVFAPLIPVPFALSPISESFGILQFISFAHDVPLRSLLDPLIVTPTAGSIAFAAFSFVCAVSGIISIARLVKK